MNWFSDVVLKTGLGLKISLKPIFFEVLVLTKAVLVLVLTLDGLKDLKNCSLKTKKVLRTFLDLKYHEAKFQFFRS